MAGMTGGQVGGYSGGGFGYGGKQYNSMAEALAAKNTDPGSKEATGQAQQAVMGLQNAGGPNAGHWGPDPQGGGGNQWIPETGAAGTTTGGGGAGSSYSIDTQGKTSSTVTPNLLPQQAQLQQAQTQLEAQLAGGARTQAGGIAGEAASKQNDYAMQQEAQRAKLAQDAFNARFAAVGGAGGSLPREQMGPGGGMNDQENQARAAAFARAKEQAGGTALGAMQGLQGAMENRGMTGSSLEAQGMGGIMGGAANGVNDFTREQLIQDLNRYSGIADETYQGNITQRGQDLARQQSLMGLISSGVRY